MSGIIKRFAPVNISYNLEALSKNNQECLKLLVSASKVIDRIWADQMWSQSREFFTYAETLDKNSDDYKAIQINKGPWSELDEGKRFINFNECTPETPPEGANYYPEDMTKNEFNEWINTLSDEDKEKAKGYFHVIRRDSESKQLTLVPYSDEYSILLKESSKLLKEASSYTDNESLKKFLTSRAESFLTNDYYQSDVDWVHLDSEIDITIGPYEVYRDRLFNAKASFESFVGIKDEIETKKLVSKTQNVIDYIILIFYLI